MVSDPISNMLISLKNASMVGKSNVSVPHSNLRLAIATVLAENGFLTSITKRGKKVKRTLDLALAYNGTAPKINDVKRISKPSKRIYKSYKVLRPVKQGLGLEILSTPAGIMTGKQAKAAKVGGESLFMIW